MMKILAIAAGGAAGTLLRYWAGGVIAAATGGTFPWGTMCVNLAGSFIIGFLWAMFETAAVGPVMRSFALIGVLGGFTTFSSFTLETFSLMRDGQYRLAFLNVTVSVLAGVIMVFAGYALYKGIFK